MTCSYSSYRAASGKDLSQLARLPAYSTRPRLMHSRCLSESAVLSLSRPQCSSYRSSSDIGRGSSHQQSRLRCRAAAQDDQDDPYAALMQAAAENGMSISFYKGQDEEEWEEALDDLDDPWAPAAPEWLDLLKSDPAQAAAALRPLPLAPPAAAAAAAPAAGSTATTAEPIQGQETPSPTPGSSQLPFPTQEPQQQPSVPLAPPLVPPQEVLELAGGLAIPCISAQQQLAALAAAAPHGAVLLRLAAGADSPPGGVPPGCTVVQLSIQQLTAAAAADWKAQQVAVAVQDTGDHQALQACIRLTRVYGLQQVYLARA